MKKLILLSLVSILLVGCINKPIEYGNYPKEYQEIIKDFYSDIVESNK
ncbi:TPA: hypothetical protein QB275_002235, partial [Pasteurella multocida]|nr:hypothetical protein [Pasteurella multocida]